MPEEEMVMTGNVWKRRTSYSEQLLYVNRRLKEVVEAILEEAEREPVLVIQSDHGPASLYEWEQPSPDFLRERMRIINAYHLPGEAARELYPSITPVNTFRLIFNYCFGTRFELLEDRNFYSNYEDPQDLREVTEIVEE